MPGSVFCGNDVHDAKSRGSVYLDLAARTEKTPQMDHLDDRMDHLVLMDFYTGWCYQSHRQHHHNADLGISPGLYRCRMAYGPAHVGMHPCLGLREHLLLLDPPFYRVPRHAAPSRTVDRGHHHTSSIWTDAFVAIYLLCGHNLFGLEQHICIFHDLSCAHLMGFRRYVSNTLPHDTFVDAP